MTVRTPLTVAISGTSGAGKSTLVRALAQAYEADGRPVAVVNFDQHLERAPHDLTAWLAAGGDPDAWRSDGMVARLEDLRSSPALTGGVVIVEEPFGRARAAISPLLDLVIHLDLSLHVALARRLLRDFVPPTGTLTEDQRGAAYSYLSTYVDAQAAVYAHIASLSRTGSDLRLDARQDGAVLMRAARAAVAAVESPGKAASPWDDGSSSNASSSNASSSSASSSTASSTEASAGPGAPSRTSTMRSTASPPDGFGKHSRPVAEGRAFFLTARLWRLAAALPVQQISLATLSDLDQDCWFDGRPPTIRAVADHARRINEADRTYPIILAADGTLMDGGHRLAQASVRGDTTIAAVRFVVDPEPDWIQLR